MKLFNLVAAAVMLVLANAALSDTASSAKRGRIIGGLAHEMPSWFKESFLDLREDAAEAAGSGKHVLLFMTLNGCPYCTKMINKVFAAEKDYISKNFDSIGINIKGDRMITTPDGKEISEKAYAQELRVVFTPTIVFLDGKARPVFRVNGYWNRKMFRIALDYVNTKSYRTMKLAAFIKARTRRPVYKFRAHPMLTSVTDFSKVRQPIAILFEDRSCTACDKLHERILSRTDIRNELKAFVFTRLDAFSRQPIIDINGNKTTAEAWANRLSLGASPTMVVFDEGKERQRIGAELYPFHFQYALRYVSSKSYKTHTNWIKYLNEQQERILKSGKDIDIGEQAPASR